MPPRKTRRSTKIEEDEIKKPSKQQHDPAVMEVDEIEENKHTKNVVKGTKVAKKGKKAVEKSQEDDKNRETEMQIDEFDESKDKKPKQKKKPGPKRGKQVAQKKQSKQTKQKKEEESKTKGTKRKIDEVEGKNEENDSISKKDDQDENNEIGKVNTKQEKTATKKEEQASIPEKEEEVEKEQVEKQEKVKEEKEDASIQNLIQTAKKFQSPSTNEISNNIQKSPVIPSKPQEAKMPQPSIPSSLPSKPPVSSSSSSSTTIKLSKSSKPESTKYPENLLVKKPKTSITTQPNITLYVNNLNDQIKHFKLKENLYLLFSAYGDVIDISIKPDIKMRGQAHITFADINSAKLALRSLQGHNFFGKPMRVSFSLNETKKLRSDMD